MELLTLESRDFSLGFEIRFLRGRCEIGLQRVVADRRTGHGGVRSLRLGPLYRVGGAHWAGPLSQRVIPANWQPARAKLPGNDDVEMSLSLREHRKGVIVRYEACKRSST
jgi:hypothetical protein